MLLLPFAWCYAGIMRLRNWLYEHGLKSVYRAPFKVIAIGNISTGGTGKTPFAEWLLRQYTAQHIPAAYLSRGYGRKTKGFLWVNPQEVNNATEHFGDEAFQVAAKFPEIPVAVCESRTVGLQTFVQHQPNLKIALLDDAFQHRKVARDLNIVLIDASRLPTEDRVLPAGRLREPIAGIRRADMLIINKVPSRAAIPSLRQKLTALDKPMAFCTTAFDQPRTFAGELLPWEMLQQRGAYAFSGIGNNAFFRSQIEAMGITLVGWSEFRDHQPYTPQDLQRIARDFSACMPANDAPTLPYILTTEKDYRRIVGTYGNDIPVTNIQQWVYLPITLQWLEGEEAVRKLIFEA